MSILGKELDEFMTRHGGWDAFERVVYVGDGGNDFCPLLRLRACVFWIMPLRPDLPDFTILLLFSQDVALVRMYRELSRRIVKEGHASELKCETVPWGGAWEVEAWLLDN